MSPLILSSIGLCLGVLALLLSYLAYERAAVRWTSSKVSRRLHYLEAEVVNLTDVTESLRSLVKRQIARDNMRKARAKKKEKENGKDEMTDEEWRAYASRRVNQGLPVE